MAESKPPRELHVLIVGAGITGCLLAQSLKQNDISFSIFDGEHSAAIDRGRKWGMSLQWALPMLKDVIPQEMYDRLQTDASVDPHYFFPEEGNFMPTYNVEDGELLKKIPLVRMLRVSRQKMRVLCSEGLDIKYGKQLQHLEVAEDSPNITAQFADGTQESGTLVVGADGAYSAVRREAFLNSDIGKAVPSGYGGVNMHVCYNDAKIATFLRSYLSPIQAIGIHPRGYWLWLSIQDCPNPNKPEDWVFQLQWTGKLEKDGERTFLADPKLQELKAEAASCFAEPWKTAWQNIDYSKIGEKLPGNRVSVWSPIPLPGESWDGKVALLGDASHPMSFQRGQGLNQGIADVVKLGSELRSASEGEKSQKDAVLSYQEEMIKRAGEEVSVGQMNTEMLHDWDRLMQSAFMQRGGDKNK